MNELSELLQRNSLFIEDKYVETILKLVYSLREKEYSISTSSLINYFTILPEYNIFNLDEIIITMKGLFSSNEQQYKEVDFYIREFFQ